MRPLAILGVLLALAGCYVLVRGLSYDKQHQVAQLGDLKASVTERRAVPPWVGGAAIVAGVVLIAAGMRKRT